MKYLKLFNTHAEYVEYAASTKFSIPNVSWCVEDDEPHCTPLDIPYSGQYLTFDVLTGGTIMWTAKSGATKTISYSINEGEWTEITSTDSGTPINVSSGDKVCLKGTNDQYAVNRNAGSGFSGSTAYFNAEGNIMSLIGGDDFSGLTSFNGKEWVFHSLFDSSNIVSAENLIMPVMTLTPSCYRAMFHGCTSLIKAPSLPSTTLSSNCYYYMFENCTSLTAAPELPATAMTDSCYRGMFASCTSLTTAPSLPATNLYGYCYANMFQGCTSLTTAPVLSAMAMGGSCYHAMFSGCTSLTTAPELLATTLGDACYQNMFDGCTSLVTPPSSLPATTLTRYCYRYMFQGCTSLTAAPYTLSATTIREQCCHSMFLGCTSLTIPPTFTAPTSINSYGHFTNMFARCTSLTTAPELPITNFGTSTSIYRAMFSGCTALTTTPVLPATTLTNSCYMEMFAGCTSLTTVQGISATTLADSCYSIMFSNCTSLTTAPELPVTTLAYSCYGSMFQGCTSLTTAPELPATTLANNCYQYMFYNCTNLTTAPELHATTLVSNCYHQMFRECRKLNYIKCLATDISADDCTKDWVYHVQNSSGTFVKSSSMNDWTTGDDGIPTNWTVHDESYIDVTGVTISVSEATVEKGSAYTLTATVLPSNADDKVVSWTSSDGNVATVDSNGVVSGVGCGNAIITVTTHDKGYTATCNMSVENHVTSVDLNTYILTLASGNTYQLVATVSPEDACDKSVTWASNNTNVATVDSNGLISGVTIGSATVTVTSNDTNSVTCNCSVTVNEGQHATGVTLNESSISIIKDNTHTLIATVMPQDAIDKRVTWSTSDASIATVDSNGVVSGVASGDATIIVTTVDGGFTAQCSVSVSEEHDYSKDYFTIESLEDKNAITFVITSTTTGNLGYYSTDNGTTWTQIESGSGAKTIATLNSGDTVLIKATSQTSGQQAKWATDYNKNSYFNATKTYKIYGNAMSLLTGDDFETATTITQECALCGLFFGGNNSTKLLDASNLVLPATSLTKSSYNGMFRGCKALQHGPKLLPALVVPQDGYSSMFESGTSLVEAPEIMATTVSGNTALNRMFCMARSGVVTAAMTKGPVLRVTNPSAYPNTYQQLFAGNGNITEVTMLAEGTNLSFANWLANVPAVGVIKKLSTTTLTSGASGVPSGWTTENIDNI